MRCTIQMVLSVQLEFALNNVSNTLSRCPDLPKTRRPSRSEQADHNERIEWVNYYKAERKGGTRALVLFKLPNLLPRVSLYQLQRVIRLLMFYSNPISSTTGRNFFLSVTLANFLNVLIYFSYSPSKFCLGIGLAFNARGVDTSR